MTEFGKNIGLKIQTLGVRILLFLDQGDIMVLLELVSEWERLCLDVLLLAAACSAGVKYSFSVVSLIEKRY